MRALTLWQPWAYAITHLGKRVENRSWAAPEALRGCKIAVHAGLRFDAEAFGELEAELGDLTGAEIVQGAVVATARLERVVISQRQLPEDQRRWWVGPYGWVLEDVLAIEPVRCRGFQGLWELPPAIDEAVIDARARALARQAGAASCPA